MAGYVFIQEKGLKKCKMKHGDTYLQESRIQE